MSEKPKFDITDFNQPGIDYTGQKSGSLDQIKLAQQLFKSPIKKRQLRTSYWNKYIIKKHDGSGNVFLWDNRLGKKIKNNEVDDIVFNWRAGTATPHKDAAYLEKKNELRILKLAKDDKLGGVRQILSDVRAQLSSDVTGPKGAVQKEFDLKRQLKIQNLEKTVNDLRIKSSYGSNKGEPEVEVKGNTQEDIDKWDLISKVQNKLEINNSDSNKSQIMIGNQKGEKKQPADTSPFTYFA